MCIAWVILAFKYEIFFINKASFSMTLMAHSNIQLFRLSVMPNRFVVLAILFHRFLFIFNVTQNEVMIIFPRSIM